MRFSVRTEVCRHSKINNARDISVLRLSKEQRGSPALESEGLTIDADEDRVVQDTIEYRTVSTLSPAKAESQLPKGEFVGAPARDSGVGRTKTSITWRVILMTIHIVAEGF